MPQGWRVTESEFSLGGGKMFNGFHHSRGKEFEEDKRICRGFHPPLSTLSL
jgi:hypothetical protein